MQLVESTVAAHAACGGGYRRLDLSAPAIAAAARPGQFIHLRVPGLDAAALRRPFSIYRADDGVVSLLYKSVGRGTRAMESLSKGAAVSLLGPLGNGFPLETAGRTPVLVAGGYGVAPLSFLARRLHLRGLLLVGGRSAADILCLDDFGELGWETRVATEDGSLGTRGLVTALLDAWLHAAGPSPSAEFFACGPDGLLRAVGQRATAAGVAAWLSLDKHMVCGLGACLACVQTVRAADGTVHRVRVCRDGPVFEASHVAWEDPRP